jgi:hypothetical protein
VGVLCLQAQRRAQRSEASLPRPRVASPVRLESYTVVKMRSQFKITPETPRIGRAGSACGRALAWSTATGRAPSGEAD